MPSGSSRGVGTGNSKGKYNGENEPFLSANIRRRLSMSGDDDEDDEEEQEREEREEEEEEEEEEGMVIKNEKRLRTGDGKKSQKLGTFGGVFLPTALNVLSILMFLRFGFVVGQMGILGSLLLLFMSYAIDLLTTLSISAIATNGTVRGGGAYYMISRSLGPEFGGSIGIVFYIGQILNSALNVVGFIEPLLVNFGVKNGEFLKILPDEGYWWVFLYSTVLLFLCTIISLTGSGLVSKAGSLFFGVLIIATISIPISTLFVAPFEIPELDSYYSGPCIKNLKENLMPHFTKKAAGSQIDGKETFNDLFGIFFPAAAGIFAGASMSGDLKKPSKAIPKGTLYGLLLTFLCYFSVILSIGIAIPRDLLYKDVHVIQSINISRKLVLLGEFSTALFSVIVGIVGAANVLEAIAKDEIIPGLKCFNNNDNTSSKASILFTWLLTQLCLFADINQIATFITMAFLMTFIVTNLACFLLKIGSAPNFRPSFDWFSSATAFVGCISCAVAMFIVDGTSAMLVIVFLLLLFLLIHYVCPPKAWGDVSQSLIYHQVRKYLLRLRQDNVKYWRPQILLLMDNPRTAWNLMSFCNHLKKGGLYILGHVIVTETFQDRFSEFKKQQQAWMKLRDLSKIKAFVQIGLGPTLSWGVRNVYLGSGLGGMKPNITVLGFYDLSDYYAEREAKDSSFSNPMKSLCTERQNTRFNNQIGVDFESLPTDSCRNENKATIQEWVHIIEDLLLLESNVAIAKGFPRLNLPTKHSPEVPNCSKEYIDLYPIQMSAQIADETGAKSALTTNFDTYTLILQLGAILNTVPEWKRTHKLRVVVFVEYQEDVKDEKNRVSSLLEVLRIKAEILVLSFSSGDYPVYNYIVKGDKTNHNAVNRVNKLIGDDEWFQNLLEIRNFSKTNNKNKDKFKRSLSMDVPIGNNNSFNFKALREDGGNKKKRRYTFSKLQKLGLSVSMRTSKLAQSDIAKTNISDSSDLSDSEDLVSDSDSEASLNNKVRNYGSLNNSRTGGNGYGSGNGYGYGYGSTMSYQNSMKPAKSPLARPELKKKASSSLSVKTQKANRNRAGPSVFFHNNRLPPTQGQSQPLQQQQQQQQQQQRQSQSAKFYNLQNTSSFFAAPPSDNSYSITGNASTISLKSRKQARPNFSSVAIPQSQVLEDASGDQPSIMFIPDLERDNRSRASSLRYQPSINNKIANNNTEEDLRINSPGLLPSIQTNSDIEGNEEDVDYERNEDESINAVGGARGAGADYDYDNDGNDCDELSFNEISAKAQHLILNDLMLRISSGSGVIFSTLPAPSIGCHKSEEDCLEYVQNLNLWCSELPPILLINSQSMTVTTAL